MFPLVGDPLGANGIPSLENTIPQKMLFKKGKVEAGTGSFQESVNPTLLEKGSFPAC